MSNQAAVTWRFILLTTPAHGFPSSQIHIAPRLSLSDHLSALAKWLFHTELACLRSKVYKPPCGPLLSKWRALQRRARHIRSHGGHMRASVIVTGGLIHVRGVLQHMAAVDRRRPCAHARGSENVRQHAC